jgi:hypothetical protein
MKVIFLDHDGVICLPKNWGSRFKKQEVLYTKDNPRDIMNEIPIESRFDNFDGTSVGVLNEILKETNAEIVVSSDWKRMATVEEMGEYYNLSGIIKKPIAFTDSVLTDDYPDLPWDRNNYLELSRSLEILKYLKNNPEVTHWVSIDDLNMSLNNNGWGLNNFVLTRNYSGIKESGVKEKVISFLND